MHSGNSKKKNSDYVPSTALQKKIAESRWGLISQFSSFATILSWVVLLKKIGLAKQNALA